MNRISGKAKHHWGGNRMQIAGVVGVLILLMVALFIQRTETHASIATVASVLVNGKLTTVVFVAGGNAHFYALNATTGAVIWQKALGTSPSYFLWSSPAVYNGSVYIGSASFGDCPLTPGQLIQMDAATGTIQHTFTDVPQGCLGGGVWGSPTIDTVTGEVYFTTGTYASCSPLETMPIAAVDLHAANLSYAGS